MVTSPKICARTLLWKAAFFSSTLWHRLLRCLSPAFTCVCYLPLDPRTKIACSLSAVKRFARLVVAHRARSISIGPGRLSVR